MMKKLITILILSQTLLAQEGRILEKSGALGDGKQYAYSYSWEEGVDTKKIISEISDGKVNYEYGMYGDWEYRIIKIDDGKRSLLVTLNEELSSSRLIEVKKGKDDALWVLMYTYLGYKIFHFSKRDKVWEKKLEADFNNFLVSGKRKDRVASVKSVQLTDKGGLLLSYKNRPDEIYSFTDNNMRALLNGKLEYKNNNTSVRWFNKDKDMVKP